MLRRIAALFVLLSCGVLLACQSKSTPANSQHSPAGQAQGTKKYQMRGVVLGIDKQKHELNIKHGDIAGFMKAMTMSYPVKDDAGLNAVAVGDEITADLSVSGIGDYWLTNVQKAETKQGTKPATGR